MSRFAPGTNTSCVLLAASEMPPVTTLESETLVSLNVVDVTLSGSTGSLSWTTTCTFSGIPVLLFFGFTASTVGGTASPVTSPVQKYVQVLPMPLLAVSRVPPAPPKKQTWNCVSGGSSTVGVIVSKVLVASSAIV